MKSIIAALCVSLGVCAATAPATAQTGTQTETDITAQYRAAHAVFLPGGNNALDQRQAMANLLAGLEGRWFPASFLADGTPDLDPETFARICGGEPVFHLAAPTPYQLTMTRTRREITLTETFDLVMGNVFQKQVDDAEFLAFMGLVNQPPAMAINMLNGAFRFGLVVLVQPSEDILVIQPTLGRPTEIYARCPSDAP